MEEFLRNRGVEESLILEMKEEGIDEAVVSSMTAEQLSKFLPRYGDCLAAIAFAKQQHSSGIGIASNRSNDRRLSLRERLVAKLQGKKSVDEHVRRSVPQEGNKNARKTNRKIELGWLHTYGPCGTLKQVRSPNGGGTRNVNVDLNATIDDLLKIAKSLFFPDGKSKKGHEKDFEFYITNQIQEKQDRAATIKQIYESTKLKMLRFYMLTCPVSTTFTAVNNNGSHKPTKKSLESPPRSLVPGNDEDSNSVDIFADGNHEGSNSVDILADGNHEGSNSVDIFAEKIVSQDSSESTAIDVEYPSKASEDSDRLESHLELYSLHSFTSDDNFPICDVDKGSNEALFYPDGLLTGYLEVSGPQVPQPQGQTSLPLVQSENTTGQSNFTLHRAIMQEELVEHFRNPSIINAKLSFSFINEKGQDADGVSRDAYAGFWESFFLRNTDGETYRVPVLSNNYSQDEWEAIGRILLKGYQDHSYFPIRFAPAFIIAIVNGEDAVSQQNLKDSFLNYLSQSEKEIIECACRGSSYDHDELLELLDRFQCHRIPNPEEMNVVITQIAHKVLIQEPKYALDGIKNSSGSTLKLLLPDIASISTIYERLNQNVAKVINLLQALPTTKEESASFCFLQRFIRGRNKEQLKRLLRLLTGSDVVCVDKIDVTFVIRHGKGRVPTIHTCGPTLELPSTYANFPDFRCEWESILDCKDSMEMSIA